MTFIEVLRKLFFTPLTIGTVEFPFHIFAFLFQFVLPVGAGFILYKLSRFGLRKLLGRVKPKEPIKNHIERWVRIVLRIMYAVLILTLFGRLLGARIFEFLGSFASFLNEPLLESGGTKITLITLMLTVPVFYLASWAGRVTRGFLNTSVLERLGLDTPTRFSVASIARYVAMVIVLMIGLSVIGIDLSALTVIFGVLGIGVGFGLQSVVANFFAGIVIIFSRPIKEGDRISVGSYEGMVLHIRLLATVVDTLTHETIIVPNSEIVNSTVHNFSYDDRRIIIENEVEVAYATDLDRAQEVLREVAGRNPFMAAGQGPEVRVMEFGGSGIRMMVRTWIRDASDKHQALAWTNLEIWRAFKNASIEIPFTQIDLHFK
jgi:potassium-dependent mechanosensitive channel